MLSKKKPSSGDRIVIDSGEEVILIKPIEDWLTYIDDNFEYDDDDPRESNPLVLAKQRWEVDKVEQVFSRERLFKCTRTIKWIVGNYCRIITEEGEDKIKRKKLK